MAKDPLDHLLSGNVDDDLFPDDEPLGGGGSPGVTPNREEHFNQGSGRFHNPETGQFEPGSPPPDLDAGVDRYRAKDGKFKGRSADLFDEPDEVLSDSLEPRG